MSDFTWLVNLFAVADRLHQGLANPKTQFVSVNISVVTNELGGSVVQGGAITVAMGSVVYVPGSLIRIPSPHFGGVVWSPPGFTSMQAGNTTFFNSLFRKHENDPSMDQLGIDITYPLGTLPPYGRTMLPTISVWFMDDKGNTTLGTQQLVDVGSSSAQVLYGTGSDGIVTQANPGGTSALYAIAPFNPEIQTPGT
jgi:hypothetical protein